VTNVCIFSTKVRSRCVDTPDSPAVSDEWLRGVGEESNIESNSSPETIDVRFTLAPNTLDDTFPAGPALINDGLVSGSFDWMNTNFSGGSYLVNGSERFFEASSLLNSHVEDSCDMLDDLIRVPLPMGETDGEWQLEVHAVPETIWQLISLFLDQLHPSMPVFKRSYLLDNLRSRRNLHDRPFNALVHAISALVIFQILQNSSGRLHTAFRVEQAEELLAEAVRLHSHIDFGEAPVLENILTSIFLFGCQFCRGNHNAARFRLHEAVTLAETMRLDDPQRYLDIDGDQRERRLRTYLCLTVIHRYVKILSKLCVIFPFSLMLPGYTPSSENVM
jgi:hypothetical protein